MGTFFFIVSNLALFFLGVDNLLEVDVEVVVGPSVVVLVEDLAAEGPRGRRSR